MKHFLAISLGAVLGANARYLMGLWAAGRWGTSFPLGTLIVNVSGSFLIGLAMARYEQHELARLFLVTGLLGGYTTFSSFSFETLALLQAHRYGAALLYVGASFAASLLGVAVGVGLGRRLF